MVRHSKNDDPKNKYTDLEKEWDKVFGYFGAPRDYSYENYKYNTDGLSFLNGYIASKVAKKAKTDKIKKLSNHIMEKGFIPKVKQTHAAREPYAVLNALFFGTGDYRLGGNANYSDNIAALKKALSKFGISEAEATKVKTLDVSKVDLYALTKNKLNEARTALVGVDADFQSEFTIE